MSCFIRKFYMNSVSHYHEPYKVNCDMAWIKSHIICLDSTIYKKKKTSKKKNLTLSPAVTKKMFFTKISQLYQEHIWHLTIPVTREIFYERSWSVVMA